MGCGASAPAPQGGDGGAAPAAVASAPPPAANELDLTERGINVLPALDPSLEKLVAADNELTALPPSIGSLSNLKTLDASGNQLTVLPVEIASCSSLEELLLCAPADLMRGGTGTRRHSWFGPPRRAHTLTVLWACAPCRFKNQLKELPKELGAVKTLTLINLFNNKLRKIPNELGELPNLEEVNIAANKLMMVADAAFTNWASVKVRASAPPHPAACACSMPCAPSSALEPSALTAARLLVCCRSSACTTTTSCGWARSRR